MDHRVLSYWQPRRLNMMEILATKTDCLEGQAGIGVPARAARDSGAGTDFSTELDHRLAGKTDPSSKSETGEPKRSTEKSSRSKDDDRDGQTPGDSASPLVASVTVVPVDVRSDMAGNKLSLDLGGPLTLSAEKAAAGTSQEAVQIPDGRPAQPADGAQAGTTETQLGTAANDGAPAQMSLQDARNGDFNSGVNLDGGEDTPVPTGCLEAATSPDVDAGMPPAKKTSDQASATASAPSGQVAEPAVKASRDETDNSGVAPSRQGLNLVTEGDTSAAVKTAPHERAALRATGLTGSDTGTTTASQEVAAQSQCQASVSASIAIEGQRPETSPGACSVAQIPAQSGEAPDFSPSAVSGLTKTAAVRPAGRQTASSPSSDSQVSNRATSWSGNGSDLEDTAALQPQQPARTGVHDTGQTGTPAEGGGGKADQDSTKAPASQGVAHTSLLFGEAVTQGSAESKIVSSDKSGTPLPQAQAGSTVVANGHDVHAAGKMVSSARIFEQAGSAAMQVKLRSDTLGSVDVRTVVKGSGIGASFRVEGRDTQMMLANELPQLERALNEKSLRVDHLDVLQGSVSGGSTDTGGSGTSYGNPPETRQFVTAFSSEPAYASLPETQTVSEDWDLTGQAGRINLRV